MTVGAEGLQVLAIPEASRVTLMLADVIHFQAHRDTATLGAGGGLLHDDLLPQPRPRRDAVPPAHGGIVPHGAVRGTAPTRDERRTPGLRAVLHQRPAARSRY